MRGEYKGKVKNEGKVEINKEGDEPKKNDVSRDMEGVKKIGR